MLRKTTASPEKATQSATAGDALGAALALCDERSTLVVIQGRHGQLALESLWRRLNDSRGRTGQQSVTVLLQRPGETTGALLGRVQSRIASSFTPPSRVLWLQPKANQNLSRVRVAYELAPVLGDFTELVFFTHDAHEASGIRKAVDPDAVTAPLHAVRRASPPVVPAQPRAALRSEVRWLAPLPEADNAPITQRSCVGEE